MECLNLSFDDWDNLTPQQYAHRCDEDVKINSRLWRELDTKLNKLYKDPEDKARLIDYLSFKLDCAKEQEQTTMETRRREGTRGLRYDPSPKD